MSLDTVPVLQNLEKTPREAFNESLRRVERERDAWKEKAEQVEQDRDSWKTKYLEQERKVQNLESFQKAVEATDLIERNESSNRSKSPTKAKLESPVTSPVSSISSASTPRTQNLERNYEILKRKYNNIDKLYREAKNQIVTLNTELEKRTEQWRGWYEWSLRVKSISPAKQTNSPPQTLEKKKEPQNCEADNNSMEKIRQIHDTLEAPEPQGLQTTSKPEIIEIDIPESPVSNPHRMSLSKETRAISVEPSRRPKSAPTQRSRASDSSIPLSTRTSGQKLKKRDYPNMKFYTEDGTDGINPRALSPVEPDGSGLLMAMLEGPPPEAPGIATPISFSKRKQSPNTATIPDLKKSTAKAGRVRELIEIESDSESGETSTPPGPIHKRQKVQSEPRLPRQLLSPDLGLRNKGRGRYSSSFLERNPGDSARLEDFEINPKNNQGVSHAFDEVVRGKEPRKNLDATSCADCMKFYPLHGPCAGAVSCNHIQKVSKHRGIWLSEPVPPRFWKSDFPTDQELAEEQEEAEKRREERLRQRAEESTRENGRWKKKDT